MDEIIQKLLNSELLSEETKSEIAESWNKSVDAYKQKLKEEAMVEVRAELADQWTKERDALVESVDKFVEEHLTAEMAELKADIDRFRDVEAEAAEKLVEEKHRLAEEVSKELDQLVDKIDAFFELRLTEEFEELKEDLEIVKQNDFGRKVFEAFAKEYGVHFIDEKSIQKQLSIAEQKLADAEKRLAESEETRGAMLRESKMKDILSSLSGKKREQMEFILKNVETAKLEEAYKYFIGRVLKEEVAEEVKEVKTVVTESTVAEETVIKTGDTVKEEKQQVTESVAESKNVVELSRLRKLAGN